MKQILVTSILIVLVSLLVSHIINLESAKTAAGQTRETDGSLTFSVRTATYNGQYAPRNSGAIWITNSANQFVKTIKVWAQQYRWTLVRWNASSNGNTTGAITGASLNNHQLHNITWNGANYQGTQVPDGEYKINVEFTEHNATASNMGKYKQITFVKGPDAINQTYPNETYFRDMALTWTPVVQNGNVFGMVTDGFGNPVAGAVIQAGAFSVTTSASGGYDIVLAAGTWNMTCTASGYEQQTANNVTVVGGQTTQQDFVLNAVANDDPLSALSSVQLLAPQPNPFRGSTTIRYKSATGKPVFLSIFNSRGQLVYERTLTNGSNDWSNSVWDGKNKQGNECPAGSYIIRLEQDGYSSSRKISLIR